MTQDPRGEPDRPGAGGLPVGPHARPPDPRALCTGPDGGPPGRHRRRATGRGRLAVAAVLAVLAAGSLLAGGLLLGRDPEVRALDTGTVPTTAVPTTAVPTTAVPTTAVPTKVPTTATATATATPAPKPTPRAAAPPAPPSGFTLPAARVSAPVVPVGVRPDGELEVPESPRTVGWWAGSAPAGSPRDTTVLAGHVDSAREGVGAFAALRDVAVGARVELTDPFRGRHTYRVVARRTYPKYALPADVFRVRGEPRLVLLTCGGPFDDSAGRYRDNVVVYAVPA